MTKKHCWYWWICWVLLFKISFYDWKNSFILMFIQFNSILY